jgi:hypothetical protein
MKFKDGPITPPGPSWKSNAAVLQHHLLVGQIMSWVAVNPGTDRHVSLFGHDQLMHPTPSGCRG